MEQKTSLLYRHQPLADAATQQQILNDTEPAHLIPFQQKMEETGHAALKPTIIDILQVNVGKMCNQVCKHCHVDAGPDRKEIMTRQTMQHCLEVLVQNPQFKTIDLTGGAPELNPDFRWFVSELRKLDRHVIVRCNLTIILANPRFNDLPQFFKAHAVEVVSSLPFYSRDRTDRQRGTGVFEQSIEALQMLNAVGYGVPGSGLMLNLVYNPAGAFMPASQQALELEFKQALKKDFGITFSNLYTITNLPISRFLDYLLQSGNYETYMRKLIDAFNPAAAEAVMCRNTISVGWDGWMYDCDFNQMLEMKVDNSTQHISNFNMQELQDRTIIVGQHCYGCTAGAGSSCGGAIA